MQDVTNWIEESSMQTWKWKRSKISYSLYILGIPLEKSLIAALGVETFNSYSIDSKIVKARKFQKLAWGGWLIKSNLGGGVILCFQCEDLTKTFLLSKFETNRPNIKLITTFCAIWHYGDLKGRSDNLVFSCSQTHLFHSPVPLLCLKQPLKWWMNDNFIWV